ncbi:hypothetical protein [Flavobacterium collinsii]|jgi:hypothetical protein|uniref:Uncharacterized protein n=1 Tax=Flavobacterium collinsii TaxID=1114861 RepID=A0A9W4THL4_9FLAO|nr:hypothetical protein [Flavobacterium collinsii]CAI2767341.1 conserved protein of unknown function [Flavobacterium collinsii]
MNTSQMVRILEDAFVREWIRNAENINTKVIDLVRESFLINQMNESINAINPSDENLINERYQFLLLSSLSKQFAFLLFHVSKDGLEVNPETIREAQEILKNSGKCPIMPCIKPKN